MVKPIRKSSNKNPPVLSHEFIIQNHADIVSCVAMVFVVGLMVQATSPFASIFIALQHNVTEPSSEGLFYSPGSNDWANIVFYCFICIIIHAVIQEYILDKISKKLHLSKSKLAIFTTSGQLCVFYLISAGWGLNLIFKERYIFELSRLWSEYPAPMSFLVKLYFIIQFSYSLHEIPELYFQRVKKEEYSGKIVQSITSLLLLYVPYYMNFNRLLVCLLSVHHTSELVFHISQLIQTVDKEEKFTKVTTLISNIVQILARLGSIILSILSLWYGFAQGEQLPLNVQVGYFNVAPVRLSILAGILGLQMYLTFKVINQEIARSREQKRMITTNKPKSQKKEKSKKIKKGEESDLPEVDQNTNKTLRKQKVK